MKLIRIFFAIFLWSLIILPSFCFGSVEITSSNIDNAKKLFLLTTPDKANKIEVEKFILDSPKRVFFDIKNATLKNIKAKTELKDSGIETIKIAQFSTKPNIVRIVFTGKEEALDAIRVTTLSNVIIFNLDDITNNAPETFVYKDPEPDASEADYFCYYEKLNVTLSNNIKKEIKPKKQQQKKETKAKKNKPIETTDENWNEIQKMNFLQNYNIENVEKTESGLKIQGIGRLSIKSPFILESPQRLIIDLPNSVLKKKELLSTIILNEDKVRFGQFDKNTTRIVIETKTPKSYNAIISPDMRTLFIQKDKNLNTQKIPLLKKASLEKFEAKQLDKQTTKITIKASEPIVHTVKKFDDGALLGLLNLNTDESFLESVIPTKQFKTTHIIPIENNFNGTYWKIPLKSSSRITTELSADGKELNIFIKDKIFASKDIVIKSGATVMIDPGHGGKDAGAIKGNLYEKTLVLELAKDLRNYLKKHGVRVFMTRYSDSTVSLKNRVYKTNKKRPDLFVSIHINSSRKPQINGIETHWYRSRSKKLAQIIHNNMTLGINSADRGMFRSKFYVINHTRVPAVLVETGFISNKKDRCDMIKDIRKRNTVKSIGNGILLYLAMKYENGQKVKK